MNSELTIRISRRLLSAALFCCSILWIAGRWSFLMVGIPGPAGDLSAAVDQYGWILQNAPSTGETPFARVIRLPNADRPDWSETTADANWRIVLPGSVLARWNSRPGVVVRIIGVRHWLVVLLLSGGVLWSVRAGRRQAAAED